MTPGRDIGNRLHLAALAYAGGMKRLGRSYLWDAILLLTHGGEVGVVIWDDARRRLR